MTKTIGRILTGSVVAAALALPLAVPRAASAQERTPHLNGRQENQHDRIQQGIKSGQLTRSEADRLRAREARLQAHKLNDKGKGPLTRGERAQLNRQANHDSRAIYRLKHNDRVR